MIIKIFGCLIVTYFLTMVSGLFSTILECFLFQNSFNIERGEIFVGGFFIAILLPVMIDGFIFLPLALWDRKAIVESPFNSLFKRCLPFIIFPFSIILITLIILICEKKGDIELLMIFAGNAYFIGIVALVIFLKALKFKL